MTGSIRRAPPSARPIWLVNQRDCPEALQLPESEFIEHLALCELVLEESCEGKLQGFVLGMPSIVPQPHFSYHWFLTRFEDFLFLERVVVLPEYQRAGIASALLARALQWSREAGLTSICCQVHDRPPNKKGHAFVLALGFVPVESVMLPSREIVTMYQRSTATATP